jgi:lipid II:glycine glycyltransferase (peptidoglycan interpeptide bridge formation enzyme)
MSDIVSIENFIQTNSPDGGFLQSDEWRKFQEAGGRKTFNISNEGFWANIIEHALPLVGKYFYIPRGPILEIPNTKFQIPNKFKIKNSKLKITFSSLIELAKKNNAGWIRFDANNSQILDIISENWRVEKAPHDMQPKELFMIDVSKPEEQLLSEMKSKTRYNIKVALKNNVKIAICDKQQVICDRSIDEFIRLVKITAQRDKITPHPDEYYRKMFKIIPEKTLKIYQAEFEGRIIAANIVVFYGKVATYLHGASDNEYRNVMAPYLLQWQAMLDAKSVGCEKYDLGGIKTESSGPWTGITRFKIGFSSNAKPIKFSGSYDIVLNPLKYNIYKILQKIKTSV